MPQIPTLLFLHSAGKGDQDDGWLASLETAFAQVGYPNLSKVNIVAPKYPNGLNGVDDEGRGFPGERVLVPFVADRE